MSYTFLIIDPCLGLFMVIISSPQHYGCYEAWEGQVTKVATDEDCLKAKKVLSSLGDSSYEPFSGGKETTGKL